MWFTTYPEPSVSVSEITSEIYELIKEKFEIKNYSGELSFYLNSNEIDKQTFETKVKKLFLEKDETLAKKLKGYKQFAETENFEAENPPAGFEPEYTLFKDRVAIESLWKNSFRKFIAILKYRRDLVKFNFPYNLLSEKFISTVIYPELNVSVELIAYEIQELIKPDFQMIRLGNMVVYNKVNSDSNNMKDMDKEEFIKEIKNIFFKKETALLNEYNVQKEYLKTNLNHALETRPNEACQYKKINEGILGCGILKIQIPKQTYKSFDDDFPFKTREENEPEQKTTRKGWFDPNKKDDNSVYISSYLGKPSLEEIEDEIEQQLKNEYEDELPLEEYKSSNDDTGSTFNEMVIIRELAVDQNICSPKPPVEKEIKTVSKEDTNFEFLQDRLTLNKLKGLKRFLALVNYRKKLVNNRFKMDEILDYFGRENNNGADLQRTRAHFWYM